MLNDEFQFYLDNQTNLAKEYDGKYLVIKGQEVIGVYCDDRSALQETQKTEKLGSFLIQKCSSDPDSVIQTYHSRVRI